MTEKKDRPEAATSERHCPGLQPRNKVYEHYIKFPAECKPQFGRGRGCFPHVLGIYAYSHRIGLSGEPAFPIH